MIFIINIIIINIINNIVIHYYINIIVNVIVNNINMFHSNIIICDNIVWFALGGAFLVGNLRGGPIFLLDPIVEELVEHDGGTDAEHVLPSSGSSAGSSSYDDNSDGSSDDSDFEQLTEAQQRKRKDRRHRKKEGDVAMIALILPLSHVKELQMFPHPAVV